MRTTGSPGSGELLSNAFFKPPIRRQRRGHGMRPGRREQLRRGHGHGGTPEDRLQGRDGNTVQDVDGTTPCGPYVLTH